LVIGGIADDLFEVETVTNVTAGGTGKRYRKSSPAASHAVVPSVSVVPRSIGKSVRPYHWAVPPIATVGIHDCKQNQGMVVLNTEVGSLNDTNAEDASGRMGIEGSRLLIAV
jgi:hypothetical protein